MKATEHYFPKMLALFITLYKMTESVDVILKCDLKVIEQIQFGIFCFCFQNSLRSLGSEMVNHLFV